MKRKKFNPEEINEIIRLYSSGEVINKEILGKMFKTSKIVINNLLKEYDIKIKTKKINYNDFILKYDNVKSNGFDFIAECKQTGKEFTDYSNSSGSLSKHIKELFPSIEIPSSFLRRKYVEENEKFWHEEYFNIIKLEKIKKVEPIKNDSEIIRLYQTTIPSTHKLGEIFKLGHKKVSQILMDNGVKIRSRGGQIKGGNSSEIEKTKISRLIANDGKKLVAKCKKTGIIIEDPNNLSGSLTTHILKEYGDVPIPNNTYQRKKYEADNGKKWFEEYFDIEEFEMAPTKKCPYCNFETKDVNNLSGAFQEHLFTKHNKSIEDYLNDFPSELPYFKNHKVKLERELELSDIKNYVICAICGEKMKILSNTHLKKHNISQIEYKIKYPKNKLLSKKLYSFYSEQYKKANITMKPRWTSKGEIEVKELIESFGLVVEKSRNRHLLNGKEIDLIIPKLKLGIEYNGLYYHTERMGKHFNYHLNKTIDCNNLDYGLIHLFEDEWVNKKDLVKHKIKHICGVFDGVKIGARNCSLKIIDSKEKSLFLDSFHIQGNDKSDIFIGAYFNTKLIGVMTFNSERRMTKNISNGEYELSRFAIDYNFSVAGLASKILSYFIKLYNPSKIISFADRRWTINGYENLYTKLGFKLIKILKPNYCYFNSKISRHKRLHKFGFGKNSLKKKYPQLDFTKTEKELMTELGYDRIWDCGLFKYELTF